MVDYYIEIKPIYKDDISLTSHGGIYLSEIVLLNLNEKDKLNKLIKECINKSDIKKIFPDAEKYIVSKILRGYDYSNSEESKKMWNLAMNSKEIKKELLIHSYKDSIEQIESIREESEKQEMLDSQEYLNYLDKLNELSIDQDRKGTL